jgi:hypothetical protein
VPGAEPERSGRITSRPSAHELAAPDRAAADQDMILSEADRLAIEAVRCNEEARAAQLRAERKAAASKRAGEAAMIAADAVRMLRTEGLKAALARLDEARAIGQTVENGKVPNGEVPAPRPRYDTPPVPMPPPIAALAPSPSFAPPPTHALPVAAAPPAPLASAPIFAGAAADMPARPATSIPPLPLLPPAPFDPDELRRNLKPSFLGMGAAAGGIAVAGVLVLVVILVAVMAK